MSRKISTFPRALRYEVSSAWFKPAARSLETEEGDGKYPRLSAMIFSEISRCMMRLLCVSERLNPSRFELE